jgi:hypothetical protein
MSLTWRKARRASSGKLRKR